MTYKHFGDYVARFQAYENHLALTIRPFIKIERLSYRQLQTKAYQTSHYLSAQGIKPGDRIMIVASNAPEWLVLFLGAQLLGVIVVSCDASSSLATTQGFAKQTEPLLIFRSKHLHPELDKNAHVLVLDDLYTLISEYPEQVPSSRLDPDQPALIVFTSGTTADPKGVVLTQKNILANITGIQTAINIGSDWRLLSVLPLSHMYELTGSLAVLSRGASIFYVPRVTPPAIAKALQEYQITTILAIPQLLVLLMERIQRIAAEQGKAKVLGAASKLAGLLPFRARRIVFRSVHARLGGHLRLAVTGGAPIPVETATAWERMGVAMLQGYGLTETSPILTVNGLTKRRLDSPGQALSNVQLRIAQNGEVQAKGPSIFKGYWHNPAASHEAFTQDGWFKTGDIGSLDKGWLHIQGRLKFAIVLSNGLKVFPEDIEVVAARHHIFKAICIVGMKKANDEAVLAVIISEKSDKEVAKAIAAINSEVESFQHIADWRRWPESDFPRTRLLKVDRRKVQTWVNSTNNQEASVTNTAETSKDSLVELIRLSLGEPHAVIKDNDRLADLGLDSLRRLTLVALIEEQLGITIPEADVLGTITVVGLRESLTQGKPAEAEPSRPTWPFNRLLRLLGNGVRETLLHGIVRIWVRIDLEGINNLNSLTLPAIFIFNHTDDFDGPVIYQAIPHHIRKHLAAAAADDVLHDHKFLAFIIRFCFAGFSLSRSEPYLPSLQYVGHMIDQGWNVFLSPEGQVSEHGELQAFKSGIGLLAVNLGVPIVPIKTIGLHGTVPLHAKWPKKRSRVTVRFGQPIQFDPDMDYDEVTASLRHIIEAL